MEKIKNNWYYYLFIFFALTLTLLGSWWVYLMFTLNTKVAAIDAQDNVVTMIKWEGITFLILIVLMVILFFYIYFLDLKKTRSLQTFFSTLTHELKTPLTSIRLQSQVLQSLVTKLSLSDEESGKLSKYMDRLEEDTMKLEHKLEETLQLSRLERGGGLNLVEINLETYLQKITSSLSLGIEVIIKNELSFTPVILADEGALNIIFSNLFDNTKKHNKSESKKILITLSGNKSVLVNYNDYGLPFTGNIKQLSELFYKIDSPTGTGIGLYLVHKLMKKMKGHLEITTTPHLNFDLRFSKVIP